MATTPKDDLYHASLVITNLRKQCVKLIKTNQKLRISRIKLKKKLAKEERLNNFLLDTKDPKNGT